MAIALVAHWMEGNANTFTTAAVDTTGANFIIIEVSENGAGGVTDISDNMGNGSYTPLTDQWPAGGPPGGRLFYKENATCGPGHTFTITGNTFANACIAAFSGVATSSSLDDQNGQAGAFSGNTAQALGALAPSIDGELIISGIAFANYTASIDSGLTITDQHAVIGGTYWGSALAYLIQTTKASINPTWTVSPNWSNSAGLGTACFKPGSVVSPAPRFLRRM